MTEENTVPAGDDLDQSLNAETSPAEEAQDDVALEDIEVNVDELDDDDDESESDESEEEEAVTESEAESEEESVSDEDEEQSGEDTTSDEDRKRAAQEAYKEREARRREMEQAKMEQQQEYLDAAEDAKDLALRQLQVDAYNNRVEKNLNKIENGLDKAIANIDLFQSKDPVVRESLAKAYDNFLALNVVIDANGDPVDVKGDVFQYLQEEAESIRRLTGIGARQEAKDKQLTKAKATPLPTKAPKESKTDPYTEAFEEELKR